VAESNVELVRDGFESAMQGALDAIEAMLAPDAGGG
jgi:ketosteroid isomerase-like protein